MIRDDKLIELQNFILSTQDVHTFMHNTLHRESAEDIMQNGFRFEGYLDFTTDHISGTELVELKYFFYHRGRYGKYTVVLQIGRSLIRKYAEMVNDARIHFSEILSCSNSVNPESGETVYVLPPHFTRGFFDQQKGKITPNPLFNPLLDLPVFTENMKFLINQNKPIK